MVPRLVRPCVLALLAVAGGALSATAQDPAGNVLVQCPATTREHPDGPAGDGRGIRCEHLAAGDGFVTMADGKLQYAFGFSRLPAPQPGVPYPLDGFQVMEQGMLNANFPAPTITVDEGDELFLTLTNVGMAKRPDLFDPHTIHWHGFPQAASVFDGVPDSSISINMGASLTYYYNVREPGTYMYHCHVEATEHMQMGMLGNLYVRPRQNHCGTTANPCPAGFGPGKYAYNDGDGSTRYDVEYPIQIGSFDPDFHDASMNVQPLPFAGMRDRYFMLNGRGYPETAVAGVLATVDPDGVERPSQPVASLITATAGQRILLRLSNLNVTHFDTVATNGIPMEVVALDAKLLRDDTGRNLYYKTRSVTLGGGQSADVILETTGLGGKTFFLYTTNLDHLANDAENFGGMMAEIRIQ